jgi:hypothetical protein
MTLGFHRRFGLYVWLGTKTHTIRAHRADGDPQPGLTLHTFIDVRQKSQTRLGNWFCSKAEPIVIAQSRVHGTLQIEIAGNKLTADERELFCWRDGFRRIGSSESNPEGAYLDFDQWARSTHDLSRAFTGQITHWKFATTCIPADDSLATGRAPLPSIYHAELRCAYCISGGRPHPEDWICRKCRQYALPSPIEISSRCIERTKGAAA